MPGQPRKSRRRTKRVLKEPLEKISLGDLIAQVKLPHAFAAIGVLLAIVSGAFAVGSQIQSSISEQKILKA